MAIADLERDTDGGKDRFFIVGKFSPAAGSFTRISNLSKGFLK